jgi:hypothetical protein
MDCAAAYIGKLRCASDRNLAGTSHAAIRIHSNRGWVVRWLEMQAPFIGVDWHIPIGRERFSPESIPVPQHENGIESRQPARFRRHRLGSGDLAEA